MYQGKTNIPNFLKGKFGTGIQTPNKKIKGSTKA